MQKKERFLKNLFKDASIYGFGTILVKASGILLIPLYWKWLTPEDFGVYAIFQIIVQFVSIIMDWGLSGAIQRNIHEWSEEESPRYVGSAFLFQLLCNLILMGLLSYFAEGICDKLFKTPNFVLYFKLAILNSLLFAFTNIPQSIFRCVGLIKKFTSLSVYQFICNALLSILFLVPLKMGLAGYIYAQVLSNFIFAVVYFPDIYSRSKFVFDKKCLKELLSFAIPSLPAGILDGIGGVFDRFFLDKYVSIGTLGLYSLSKQVAGIYNLFLVSLKSAWLPMIYKIVSTRDDGAKILGKITVQYTFVLAVIGIFIASTVKDLIYLLNMPKYNPVADYAPLIILAYFFQGVGHVTGRGLDLAKKTQYFWIMYAVAISTGVYSILKLTPKYGVWGAGFSFLISILARELVQFALSYLVYPREINWKKFFAFVPFFLSSYFLCNLIKTHSLIIDIVTKLMILMILSCLYAIYIFGWDFLMSKSTNVLIKFKKLGAL